MYIHSPIQKSIFVHSPLAKEEPLYLYIAFIYLGKEKHTQQRHRIRYFKFKSSNLECPSEVVINPNGKRVDKNARDEGWHNCQSSIHISPPWMLALCHGMYLCGKCGDCTKTSQQPHLDARRHQFTSPSANLHSNNCFQYLLQKLVKIAQMLSKKII